MRRACAADRTSGSEWNDWSSNPTEGWGAGAAPAPGPAAAPDPSHHQQQQSYEYQPPQRPTNPLPPLPTPSVPAGSMQPMQQQQPASDWQQPYVAAAPATATSAMPATAPQRPAPTGYTGNVMMPSVPSSEGSLGNSVTFDAVAGGAASMMGLGGDAGGGVAAVQQLAAGAALQMLSGKGGGVAAELEARAATYTGSTLAVLRYYFEVNNRYVLEKLRLLLLPYRHASWGRKVSPHGGLRPPSEDVNAPDLYIPAMAYVTYILVAGYVSGADGRFTPEVLGSCASSGLVIVLLELVSLKLAFYLLQPAGGSAPALDLTAVSGYKFVGVTLALVLKLTLGAIAGYVGIMLAGAGVGTFMAKSLRQSFADAADTDSDGYIPSGMGSPGRKEKWKKQSYALLGFALLQPLFFWYLCSV